MNSDMFRGISRLPAQNKMKADTKLAVFMCCQIFDRKSEASSNGNFWQRLAPRQSCTHIQEFEEFFFWKVA